MNQINWKHYADKYLTYDELVPITGIQKYYLKLLIKKEDPASAERISRNGRVKQRRTTPFNRLEEAKRGHQKRDKASQTTDSGHG